MRPYYLNVLPKKWGATLHGYRWMDIADCQAAVVPTRIQKIKKRKLKRRILNKRARIAAKKIDPNE
jgi:hypothetical protein